MDARIRELADAAEIIVVADLEALGPSPGVWSGRYVAYQEARYHNIEYLKQRPGTTHGADTLVVLHPLVSGSPTADPDRPALRASLFHPAARLILFLRRQEESLITWDERDGATPATPKLVEALKQGFSESGP